MIKILIFFITIFPLTAYHFDQRIDVYCLPIDAISEDLTIALIKYGNNSDGMPALHAAIKAKDEKAVRLFLDYGADPNACTQIGPKGWSMRGVLFSEYPIPAEVPVPAINIAAAFGNTEIINLLIDRGAIVNPAENEITPLMCAARFNNSEAIQILAERGADLLKEWAVKENSGYGGNALHFAAMYGSAEAVKTLLALGLSPNCRSSFWGECTPLLLSCMTTSKQDTYSAIEALLQNGADPNLKYQIPGRGQFCLLNGPTVFHFLADRSNGLMPEFKLNYDVRESLNNRILNISELLILYGTDINVLDFAGRSPISITQIPFFKNWLREHGAIE